MVKVKLHSVMVDKIADFFVDLALVVLSKVHERLPAGVEAVLGQSTLHLLRVKEVEVCPEKFAPRNTSLD